MVYALRYLRGDLPAFATDTYDIDTVLPYEKEIKAILVRRQLNACEDWKAFGEALSGREIDDFDIGRYQQEYLDAEKGQKGETFLGKFFLAALMQKSMVTNKIYTSGNKLAGISVDYDEKGFRGMTDFAALVDMTMESNITGVADDLQRLQEGEIEELQEKALEAFAASKQMAAEKTSSGEKQGGEDC